MHKVELQAAYILHSRPYRDSSLIAELLTLEHGRISVVVRGVKGSGKAAQLKRSLLQPFIPLLASWQGKSDLKTLIHIEANGTPLSLQGRDLFSALYINELLTRLLPQSVAQPELFQLYQWALASLPPTEFIDVVLRRFELQLLECLGYGLVLSGELESGAPIEAEAIYRFYPDQGFRRENVDSLSRPQQFSGADLLALAENDFSPRVRQAAKRLCRLALKPHLGSKPLKSRDLFK